MLSDFPEERKWSPWARPLLPMIRQWSQLTDQLTTLLLINLRSCNNGQATKWNPTSTVPVVIPLQSLLQIWCSIIWWIRCNSDAAVGSSLIELQVAAGGAGGLNMDFHTIQKVNAAQIVATIQA